MYFFSVLLMVIMAVWFGDEDFFLAGLTQENHDVDIETISSDDKPETNFKLLLGRAKVLSNNVLQISNFDDKIFQLSHGSTTQSEAGFAISGESSHDMVSSMVLSDNNLQVPITFL